MSQVTKPSEKTFMGHPQGLFYLFFAEMWERFSFYGMRALLVLYLVSDLFQDLADKKEIAYEIYAAYGALVYFTPAIGGMIADRLIGHKNSIILGAILMCLGHFVMAFPSEYLFYTALGLLIIGNGFFKPNISTMVGGLYEQGDVRRDGGFTIFYMGINVGAFIAPLACGWLGNAYGWHWGFGAAGVGMALGLLVFWRGMQKNIYGDQGEQPEVFQKKKVMGFNVRNIVWALAFLSVPLFAFLVNQNAVMVPGLGMDLMTVLLWSLLIVVMVYIVFLMITKLSKQDSLRLVVVVFLTFFVTIFWAFFEQAGSSLTLFAEEQVNLVGLSAAQTNSINPGYIMLLAIPFSMMWRWLAKKKLNPITPVKFALAIFQLGLGFLIFAWSMNSMDEAGRVPMMFLMFGYLLLTTGELFASPIGLSKITELSPGWLVAFMMGVWFLSSSFAHHIAGIVAKLTVTKETSSYVERTGFADNFAGFFTGADQNAMGQFTFDFTKAYNSIADTAVHDKTVNFKNEETGAEYTMQLNSLEKINDSIATVNKAETKGKFVAVDTTFTINPKKYRYPTVDEFNKFKGTLKQMAPVNEDWAAASVRLEGTIDSLAPAFNAIQAQNSPDKMAAFHKFKKVYYGVQSDGDVLTIIKSKEDKGTLSEDEFEAKYGADLKRITKAYPEKFDDANAYVVSRESLAKIDPAFAKNAYAVIEGFYTKQGKVRSLINLGTYTNVFALIGLVSLCVGLFALLMAPFLKRWMGGIH